MRILVKHEISSEINLPKSGYVGIGIKGISGKLFEFDTCLCCECNNRLYEGIAVLVILLNGSVKNEYCLYLCRHVNYIFQNEIVI